ncbi:MAG: 3-deoxy-7-phosphoheptulonate synthase, partial [Saprospiraceae bacterium]
MAILFDPVFPTDREGPLLMAGPCSAETREQTLLTARQLCAHADVIRTDLFRAGIWKPRTMPGAFEGVGAEGL